MNRFEAKNGKQSRLIFEGRSRFLAKLRAHATVLDPGGGYAPHRDAYDVAVVLLARVITKLGSLPSVSTGTIESLFSADFAYLQDFYRRINEDGTSKIQTCCPECNHEYEVDLGNLGGS